jgi:DNA-binding phage protein
MSPYQQDIINTTLQEYDVQAQKGLPQLAAQAIGAGAFGGGREGVQRAEYQQASDRNRAALQAQLLQQGFGQAQQSAQQDYLNQLNLGGQQQAFLGQDIGALQTFGGINQAQKQAQLTAQQQLGQAQSQQGIQAAQTLGSGITSLIAGYPGQTQQTIQPTPGALQTALGAGATLAGVYRAFS